MTTDIERNISPCIKFLRGYLRHGSVGAEIGIWDGGNALVALQQLGLKTYYMIDPYVEYADNNYKQAAYEEMYQAVFGKFSGVPEANFMRVSSMEAARTLHVEFDFVYIDGAHDYKTKMADLGSWYAKLRPGGILCGDDYNIESVSKAVNDFSRNMDVSFWVSNYSEPHPPEFFMIRSR